MAGFFICIEILKVSSSINVVKELNMSVNTGAFPDTDRESMLKIYTLGRFSVVKGSEQLSSDYGRSRKLWDLLMYFVAHREKPLSPENIAESLWPGQEYDNPANPVKNLVYRLRQKIDDEDISPLSSFVINVHGCYAWNPDYPYWLDIEAFEQLCHEAKDQSQSDLCLACNLYRQATSLYQGDFCSERPYNDWLMPVRHYYRQRYIRAATNLLLLLKKQHLYSQMLEECEKAFKLNTLKKNFIFIT